MEDKVQTPYLSARPSAARSQPTGATSLPAPLLPAVLGRERGPWLCSSEWAVLSFQRTLVCTLERPPCSNLCPSLTPRDCWSLPLPCFHATLPIPHHLVSSQVGVSSPYRVPDVAQGLARPELELRVFMSEVKE